MISASFKDETVAICVTAETDSKLFFEDFTPIAYDHTPIVNFFEVAVPYICGMYSYRATSEKNVQILSGVGTIYANLISMSLLKHSHL